MSTVRLHIHTGKTQRRTEIIKKKKKNQKEIFPFFFLLAPTPQWTQILFTATFTFLRSLRVLPRPCCRRRAGGWWRGGGPGQGGAGCSGDQPGKKRGRTQLVGSLWRFAAAPVTRWGGRKHVFLGKHV